MEELQTLISTYDKINMAALTSENATSRDDDMIELRAAAEKLKEFDSDRFKFVTDEGDAKLMLSIKNFIAKQL